MSNFLKYFSKLIFSKPNNAKIIPLIIFYTLFSHIIISVTLKSNFTKEGIYFIYDYTCL